MKKKQYDLLEKCIEIIEAGGSVDECKRIFPELSEDIQDMLTIVRDMEEHNTQVTAEQKSEGLSRMLSQSQKIQSVDGDQKRLSGIKKFIERVTHAFQILPSMRPLAGKLSLAFSISALLVIISGGLVIGSAKSIPGEPLYRVKRAVEEIRVYLIPNRAIRQKYENDYNLERVGEVKDLISLKRVQSVSFEGVIDSMSGTNWVVSGIQVSIQPGTSLEEAPDGMEEIIIGSTVEVDGTTHPTGIVMATGIHLRGYTFYGQVESIGAKSWQIGGVELLLTAQTSIDKGIKAGDFVIVSVRSEDQGLYAVDIALATDDHEIPTATENPSKILPPASNDDYNETGDIGEDHSTELDTEETAKQPTQEAIESETTEDPLEEEHHETPALSAPDDENGHEDSTSPEQHETPQPTEEHEEDH